MGYVAESETNQSEYSSVSQTKPQKSFSNRRKLSNAIQNTDIGVPPRTNSKRGLGDHNARGDSTSKKMRNNIGQHYVQESGQGDVSPNKRQLRKMDTASDNDQQFYSLQHSSITANAKPSNQNYIRPKGTKKINSAYDKSNLIRGGNGSDMDTNRHGYFSQKKEQNQSYGVVNSPMRESSNLPPVSNDNSLQKQNSRHSMVDRSAKSQVTKQTSNIDGSR